MDTIGAIALLDQIRSRRQGDRSRDGGGEQGRVRLRERRADAPGVAIRRFDARRRRAANGRAISGE